MTDIEYIEYDIRSNNYAFATLGYKGIAIINC